MDSLPHARRGRNGCRSAGIDAGGGHPGGVNVLEAAVRHGIAGQHVVSGQTKVLLEGGIQHLVVKKEHLQFGRLVTRNLPRLGHGFGGIKPGVGPDRDRSVLALLGLDFRRFAERKINHV